MFDFKALKQHYFEANDERLKLLSEVKDYNIYTFFIGREVALGEFIQSPIRVDNTPSFNLYTAKRPPFLYDDMILFKDYSGPSGNVFQFVEHWAMFHENRYFKNLKEICDYIREKMSMDPNHIAHKVTVPERQESKHYHIAAFNKYTSKHKEYLDDLGISKEMALDVYQALPCEYLMNEHQQVVQNFRGTVTFAYVLWRRNGTMGFKLYQPKEENFIKFFLHADSDIPQGYWQCKGTDTLILGKSLKDIMVMQSHINEWIDMVAPHGEGYAIRPEWLGWYLQYKRIIIMYDPDLAGIGGANRIRKALLAHPNYNGQQIDVRFVWNKPRILRYGKMVVPIKDSAEYRLVYGGERMRERMEQMLE